MPVPPNILLLHAHDLGRRLGCYGRNVSTPRIDALADQGVRFTRAFATAPHCSPSRASMFTGLHPQQHGVMGLTNASHNWDMRRDVSHLAQSLHAAGFRTGAIGVFHEAKPDPARFGLDVFRPGKDAGEIVADTAAFLRGVDDHQPFYLQVGFREPHRIPERYARQPVQGFLHDDIGEAVGGGMVPDYLLDTPAAREEIGELDAAISYMDRHVGQVLDLVRERGLLENTLIVFTTDHGVALPRAKCTLYDPGLEIALIVRSPTSWPGASRATVCDALVSNVDLAPSLLEAVDVVLPQVASDVRPFAAALRDEAFSSRACLFAQMTFHHYYDARRCVRDDRTKLIVNFATSPAFMDASQSWTPRCRPVAPTTPGAATAPVIELYDLDRDPLEQDNLAASPDHVQVLDRQRDRLLHWMQSVCDPLLDGPVASPRHHQALTTMTGETRR